MEEADISRGCSVWNRTSKLILHRLLWHRRAVICCQRDEDPGPVPLVNAEALIRQTFPRFPSSPSPDRSVKVKEVRYTCVLRPNGLGVGCVAPSCAAARCCFLCEMGVLFSRILCENNFNDAVPDITAPKWCSSMKRERKTEKKTIRR